MTAIYIRSPREFAVFPSLLLAITLFRLVLNVATTRLILSGPGLRAEAEESGMPIEQVEFRAVQEAAGDVARNYGVNERRVTNIISSILAHYGG